MATSLAYKEVLSMVPHALMSRSNRAWQLGREFVGEDQCQCLREEAIASRLVRARGHAR
jgi:hypothetical protein